MCTECTDLVNFVKFSGTEFVEVRGEVEQTVARMTELLPPDQSEKSIKSVDQSEKSIKSVDQLE